MKLSKAVLDAMQATVAERKKGGQTCRMCRLPAEIREGLTIGRTEQAFTYADCASFLRKVGHPIAASSVRTHFVSGHGNP